MDKLYFVAVAKSTIAGFADLARAAGMTLPDWIDGEPAFGTDDDLVATSVDCSAVVDRKYAALAAHASQVDNGFFLDMGPELFGAIFSVESFVRARRPDRDVRCPRTTCSPGSRSPGRPDRARSGDERPGDLTSGRARVLGRASGAADGRQSRGRRGP